MGTIVSPLTTCITVFLIAERIWTRTIEVQLYSLCTDKKNKKTPPNDTSYTLIHSITAFPFATPSERSHLDARRHVSEITSPDR